MQTNERLTPFAGVGLIAALLAFASFDDDAPKTSESALHPPVRLSSTASALETEAPGYASPAWHDVNGDGRHDLVVGQFAGGKMMVFPRAEDGTFGAREWIMAGEKVAEVPGVW